MSNKLRFSFTSAQFHIPSKSDNAESTTDEAEKLNEELTENEPEEKRKRENFPVQDKVINYSFIGLLCCLMLINLL